jgi:hypothetical protein
MLAPRYLQHVGAVALISAALPVQQSLAQRPTYHYAAKIICHDTLEVTRSPLQMYWTTINVHNPSDTFPATFLKRLAALPAASQRAVQPMLIAVDTLGRDSALAIDCRDLRNRSRALRRILPAFFEGFVLIDSDMSLDVVAVYSVPGGVDVERVAERVR